MTNLFILLNVFSVTIKLNVSNMRNLDFESITHFVASNCGVIDLHKSVPVGHNYYRNPDPMGIFWTMNPLDPSENVKPPMTRSDKRFWALDVPKGLNCKFEVFLGNILQRV